MPGNDIDVNVNGIIHCFVNLRCTLIARRAVGRTPRHPDKQTIRTKPQTNRQTWMKDWSRGREGRRKERWELDKHAIIHRKFKHDKVQELLQRQHHAGNVDVNKKKPALGGPFKCVPTPCWRSCYKGWLRRNRCSIAKACLGLYFGTIWPAPFTVAKLKPFS